MALSQKIVSRITDAIVRGELKPGDKLPSERELAAQFQVSRTAIRDAIKILSGRGVLRVRHGAGIFVEESSCKIEDTLMLSTLFSEANLNSVHTRDLFEIRKTLETQAAEWAANRAEAVHLKRLRTILNEARKNKDDLSLLSEHDARFHVAIAEASQNLLLVKIMWGLLDALSESRKQSLKIPNRALVSLREHEFIVKAIEIHDPIQAREAMFNHLTSVESSIEHSRRPCRCSTPRDDENDQGSALRSS